MGIHFMGTRGLDVILMEAGMQCLDLDSRLRGNDCA